ncbi:MAG: PadR family transcriptional regulator [Candidatus Krumholzibacteria bacterium]|nr:PadR family transcriptional regulator [Candidatus Krumholzibacteria bacterium]
MATKLTELEGCVLGLVWEMGTCTTYAIRKVFQRSPNPYWSGSAGAIYPLVRRLESSGLLRAREDYTGQRRRDLYEVTARGLRELRSWVGPRVLDWSVSIPVDLLRTRIRFLGVLKSPERAEFLANAEQQLLRQIREAEKECRSLEATKEPYPYLVARGVAKIARARLSWIREATALLC